jgi:pimeloyl-ACP methyl ester carboxylesterase
MSIAHVNGVDLYYEDHGQGFPIVLAHGFSATARMWEPQVAAFAGRYRVITYDARGQGRSGVPKTLAEFSQPRMIEDLHLLLRHLGIDRACVGGLSMGGNVALNFALEHPSMVMGLLVCDTGAGSDEAETWAFKVRRWVAMLETDGVEAFAEDYIGDPILAEFANRGPEARAFLKAAITSSTAAGLAGGLAGAVGSRPSIYALADRMAALTMPVVIVVGDRDHWCTKVSRFMAASIPGAELVEIRDSGHMTNLEQPGQFNRAVERLLARIAGTKGRA